MTQEISQTLTAMIEAYQAKRTNIRSRLQLSPAGNVKEPCYFDNCHNKVVMPVVLATRKIQLVEPNTFKVFLINHSQPAICDACRAKAFDQHRKLLLGMVFEVELWTALLLRKGLKGPNLQYRFGQVLACRTRLQCASETTPEPLDPPTSLGCACSSMANLVILAQEYQYNGHCSLGFGAAMKMIESD